MSSVSTGGTEGSSPASSPASTTNHQAMAAPKYGTLVPNRIFVGGIAANTSEAELADLFSAYGTVKATKIILDRGGVSKGYGFVTFETEEEAKRLQQESECIVLRERKLNIAPAIKKQTTGRSSDGGSGSPPVVPTSPYGYYPNGMGLPYQNGLTFYNAGGPAPGTPLAPPTDPSAIYQAAGVFGPQAASAHQTFAPMMYPCPAPSLYMPQQYQYSPMPYESYFTGAAGAPPYLYHPAPSSSGTTNGGTGIGTNSSQNSTGATSPPTNSHHFYPPHNLPHHNHHPGGLPSGPASNQAFQDTFYYGFQGVHSNHQQQPQNHQAAGGIGDQQLLLYTTDCQQPASNDNQGGQQEDTRPTSTHSQTDPYHHQNTQTTSLDPSTTLSSSTLSAPLVSLMPLKYPITPRYTSYPHPLTLHPQAMAPTPGQNYPEPADDTINPALHCRTFFYPPFYMPAYNPTAATTSLLPTPNNQQKTLHKNPNGLSFFPSLHHQTHSPKSQAVRTPQTPRKLSTYSPRANDRSSIVSNSSGKSQSPHSSAKTANADNARRNLKIGFMAMKSVNGSGDDEGNGSDKPTTSPPPAPYSPMTRPLPNFSPTNFQMQFYNAQGRFHSTPTLSTNQMSSQQIRRYPAPPHSTNFNSQIAGGGGGGGGRKIPDKFTSGGLIVRSNKFKVNGLNTKALEDGIAAGAGDSHQAARIQMTPPSTPRNVQDNSMPDACHKMQALTL